MGSKFHTNKLLECQIKSVYSYLKITTTLTYTHFTRHTTTLPKIIFNPFNRIYILQQNTHYTKTPTFFHLTNLTHPYFHHYHPNTPTTPGLKCHLDNSCYLEKPCHPSAVCNVSPYDGSFSCSCDSGWEGKLCDEDIDECSLGGWSLREWVEFEGSGRSLGGWGEGFSVRGVLEFRRLEDLNGFEEVLSVLVLLIHPSTSDPFIHPSITQSTPTNQD